jgi:beta-phosphoglucomutase-like phosphatase (HAD superfamily)
MSGSGTPAVVLDCDGVLADTERDGHLVAFNQTFAEFGLPLHWSEAQCQRKLSIGGGKERMASLLTPEFVAAAGLPGDPAGQRAAVAAWHRRKTEIYAGLVASGAVPPRPGIARLVGEALVAGWPVAAASTSAERSVTATLQRAVGADQAAAIKVLAGDIVPHKKPASANDIVDELLDAVVTDLPFSAGDDVALMVNGLGGTPVSELYLLYGYAHEQLSRRGINIRRNYVGNYCTSLDMAGTSITLSRLDPEIEELLAAPAEIAIRTF